MRAVAEHVTHPDQAFRLMPLALGRFSAGPHRHPQLELTWIERDAGLRLVGDSTEPYASGDLVLLGPELPHAWISAEPAADDTAPRLATVLQFSPALFDQPLWPELQALRPLLAQAGRGLAVGGAAREAITALLRAMPAQDRLGQLATWVAVMRELAAATELRALSSRTAGMAGTGPRRIDAVTAWVHTHLAEPLDVNAAAEVAHISPAAFSRFFKRETGKTFTAYVNDMRIGSACLHLRQARRPVAEVAAACGFTNAAHFDRQFKRRMGCSPRAYRSGGKP